MIGFIWIMHRQLLSGRNMIFPVFGICATIYGSGIQTAISHLTASVHNKHASTTVLFTGILLSLSLSLSLAGIIFFHSDFIAEKLLLEPSTARPLRILVTLFPFCVISLFFQRIFL